MSLPTKLLEIEDGAFIGCNITTLTIPEYVLNIGYVAFAHCYIHNLTIEGCCSIKPGAFKTINKNISTPIDTCYCKSDVPPINERRQIPYDYDDGPWKPWDYGGYVASAIYCNVLCVPKGCKDIYRSEWDSGSWKEIIEVDY